MAVRRSGSGPLREKLANLAWSPDGTRSRVLVTDPETDADKKKRRAERPDPRDQDLKYTRLWVVEVESGKTRQLTFGKDQCPRLRLVPDGRSLAVATSTRTDAEAEFQDIEISLVSVTGGRLAVAGDASAARAT